MNSVNPDLYIKEIETINNSITCYDKFTCSIQAKYLNIANLYKSSGNLYKINNLNKSSECYELAILYYKKLKDNHYVNISECYINSGLIYQLQKNNKKAINNYIEGTKIFFKLGYYDKIAKYYEHIGDLYVQENKKEKAIIYYKDAINYNNTIPTILRRANVCYKISIIYVKDFADYHNALNILNDMFNVIKMKGFVNINYKTYFYYISLLLLLLKEVEEAKEYISHTEAEYGIHNEANIIRKLVNSFECNDNDDENKKKKKICEEIINHNKNDELIKLLVMKICA